MKTKNTPTAGTVLLAVTLLALASACSPGPAQSPSAPSPAPPTVTNTVEPTPAPSATPQAVHLPPELIARLDAWLTQIAADELFSGSVLIAQGGDVLRSKGYGLADRENKTPNTPQTHFRLASVSKQFTAMAILILEAQGRLQVQDSVCRYIPDCPPAWEPVTIHHLLTHTSGMPDFSFPNGAGTLFTPEQTIATFRDLPLYFPAGEEWSYSNSGYILLGEIIRQVSGMSYEEFLKESIFLPLELHDTGYAHSSDTLAIGYDSQYTSLPADPNIAETFDSAGALYSSAEDLYLWDQALYAGNLIPRASLDRMFTPQVKVPTLEGREDWYGYGWLISQRNGHTAIWHGGGLPGVSTIFSRYPQDQVTIIVLCNNANSDAANIWELIAKKIFETEAE